jgi:uncharacterized protein with HEPN domain
MKKDDTVYLQHMLDAIHRIETYTHDISKEDYLQNGLLQDGIVRQLEIIGQASTTCRMNFRKRIPIFRGGKSLAFATALSTPISI